MSAADLTEALTGRFTEHHAFMTRLLLNRIDQHNAAIQQQSRVKQSRPELRFLTGRFTRRSSGDRHLQRLRHSDQLLVHHSAGLKLS